MIFSCSLATRFEHESVTFLISSAFITRTSLLAPKRASVFSGVLHALAWAKNTLYSNHVSVAFFLGSRQPAWAGVIVYIVATMVTEVTVGSQVTWIAQQQWLWISLLPSLFFSSKNYLSPQLLWAVVNNETTCCRHRPCWGVKNTFAVSVYSKEYTFPILSLRYLSSPNKLTSSAQIRSGCVPLKSNLCLFSWTFLMAYYKANLKSNGDKADKRLCIRSPPQV
jgi:hypothetical protein